MFYVEPIPAPDGSEIECGKQFVGMMPRPLINMSDSVFSVCSSHRKKNSRSTNALLFDQNKCTVVTNMEWVQYMYYTHSVFWSPIENVWVWDITITAEGLQYFAQSLALFIF